MPCLSAARKRFFEFFKPIGSRFKSGSDAPQEQIQRVGFIGFFVAIVGLFR